MEMIQKEELIELLKSPANRIRFLNSIIYGLLQNKLITKDEMRKEYYNFMAIYFSAQWPSSNEREDIIEANLIDRVESAFIDAINRRELSEWEKNEIRREQARIAEDFKRCQIVGIDKSFVDELKKFQWEKDE